MSKIRTYSHSMTILVHSFPYSEKHEFCILINDELWQVVIYIFRHTNSSKKEIRLIDPKNKRLPYFLLMFGRPQIDDKHAGLKV
jgi:hypothetical protein